jgi:hypothetical protein
MIRRIDTDIALSCGMLGRSRERENVQSVCALTKTVDLLERELHCH